MASFKVWVAYEVFRCCYEVSRLADVSGSLKGCIFVVSLYSVAGAWSLY